MSAVFRKTLGNCYSIVELINLIGEEMFIFARDKTCLLTTEDFSPRTGDELVGVYAPGITPEDLLDDLRA